MKTERMNISNILSSESLRDIAIVLISTMLIFLFIYSASDKLLKVDEFSRFMEKLAFLKIAPGFVAWSIPVTEILISVMILIPQSNRKGLIASVGLLTIFTAYLIYMKYTAEHLPCHCGGVISTLSWTQHIWFNLTFILLAIAGIYLQRRQIKGG